MTQLQVALHRRGPQIQVAVFQAQILVHLRIVQREWRHLGLVQHFELAGNHLNLAGGEPSVFGARKPGGNRAGHLDHILAAQPVGSLGNLWMFLRTKDHLREAFPIPKINENDAAVVAPGVDPAG